MVTPGDISGIFDGLLQNFGGIAAKALGWAFVMGVMFGFIAMVYILFQYKYKVTLLLRRGSGVDDEKVGTNYAIGKIMRYERARVIKKKGIVKWKLLFGRKEIEPVDSDLIYPGNNIFLYKFSSTHYTPAKWTITGNPEVTISPLPRNIRFWEQLEIQQSALDYQSQHFWDKYGSYVIVFVGILLSVLLAGFVIWLSFKQAGDVVPALKGLTESIKDSQFISGISR